MKYKIFINRVKLFSSCDIPKARFSRELDKMRNLHPSCRLWSRADGNIKREWAAHNLAYSLGIKDEKTKDCDLEFNPMWYMKLLYAAVGTIALWIIE